LTNSNIHSRYASFKRGLRGKFLIILVVGAAFTTICSALFGYFHGRTLRYEGTGTAMQKTAERVSSQIEASMETAAQLMTDFAASAELRSAMPAQSGGADLLPPMAKIRANMVLAAFASRHPDFKAIRLVASGGENRGEYGQLEMPYQGQEKWWDSTGRPPRSRAAISGPIIERKPASVCIHISVPVVPKKRGGFSGELHAKYSLDNVTAQQAQDKQEILAFLLTDTEGRRLYVIGPPAMASSQPTPFREPEKKIFARSSGHQILELNQSSTDFLAGYAPVRFSLAASSLKYEDGKTWLIVAGVPKSNTMEPVNVLFSQAIGFGGIVLIIVSLVGLAFSHRILRPIHVLQEGVQEIGQGNLEHRIDIRSGDEIEMLASEFNRMAERMQRAQEQLQRRGKELGERVNQLRRLQAQLMQSERMAATGELAAQIAHEINNPLGIMKNYVGIAKMLMTEEDPNRENLKIVDQEIGRIAGIVRRLLRFAKPGMEDIQSAQINQVIEELLALLRGQLFRRKIDVSLDLSETLPEVNVSTDQMRQVFLNLVKNAEDAMPDGGNLVVRTRFKKGNVEVEISDSGCGIPAEDVKNIFEPFFTTKGVKGTGLGLSVSYGIVKNYNGEIKVESEPGVGTTFTIQLPVISDSVFQVVKSSS